MSSDTGFIFGGLRPTAKHKSARSDSQGSDLYEIYCGRYSLLRRMGFRRPRYKKHVKNRDIKTLSHPTLNPLFRDRDLPTCLCMYLYLHIDIGLYKNRSTCTNMRNPHTATHVSSHLYIFLFLYLCEQPEFEQHANLCICVFMRPYIHVGDQNLDLLN